MVSDEPATFQGLQQEVQRKFGRNLLRLQQIEQLTKRLLVGQEIAGPVDKLERIRAKRKQEVTGKTLGQTVGELTGNYFALRLQEAQAESDAGSSTDCTSAWMRISFQMEMEEDQFRETERKLSELVTLRNNLVHHFLDDHDIGTEQGCRIASAYLDDCFKEIEGRYDELCEWAKNEQEARSQALTLFQTPEILDFFDHGILPDGAGVTWPSCTIVRLLTEAESSLARDGWTLLEEAVNYVKKVEPEHTPERYGCSSWRQVLHESAQFDVRKEKQPQAMPTLIWYRRKLPA